MPSGRFDVELLREDLRDGEPASDGSAEEEATEGELGDGGASWRLP